MPSTVDLRQCAWVPVIVEQVECPLISWWPSVSTMQQTLRITHQSVTWQFGDRKSQNRTVSSRLAERTLSSCGDMTSDTTLQNDELDGFVCYGSMPKRLYNINPTAFCALCNSEGIYYHAVTCTSVRLITPIIQGEQSILGQDSWCWKIQ